METQDYMVATAAFFLAAGAGFLAHQTFLTDQKYSEDVSVRVSSDSEISSINFDGNYLELRYEDTPKAKFYFKFNDTRDVEQLEGLKHDGTLQTTTEIRSFGNKTYFLYLKYQDDPNQTEGDYMELYRIEET